MEYVRVVSSLLLLSVIVIRSFKQISDATPLIHTARHPHARLFSTSTPDFSFQTESTFYFHTGEQETDFKWMLDHLVLKYKVKSFWKFGVNDKWFKQDERTYVKFTFNEATFLPTSK